jgi:endo-1,4-beta-xylanase
MKRLSIISLLIMLLSPASLIAKGEKSTLKDAISPYFLIGVAMNADQVWMRDSMGARVARDNFNSVVAENCMKGEVIHPEEDRYEWIDADQTVKFGQENGMTVIGHCLVWHSQPPKWMFTYANGDTVSRYVLIDRMYHHITTVMSRYKGKVKGWDVVNEAINDDGSFRETPYYKIIGPDYIRLAFQFAHEADPEAELYYNDYNLSNPQKRAAVCQLVKSLKTDGCRIDAVGMQSHNGYDYPDLNEYEKSIDAIAATGVKVMMTELDLNMLPTPKEFSGAEISQNFAYNKIYNPYIKGLDRATQKTFNERYLALFGIYRRHASQISRVTLWGVSDASSWLNDWPIPGRTNYPLLFDRHYQPKPIIKQIINLFK